jgi:hypothetical protein
MRVIIHNHLPAKDGTFSRTSPNVFGKLAGEARREKGNEAAGRNTLVYKLKKDGSRSNSPFASEQFTPEDADKKIKYWEGLNPGSKFVAVRS